MIDLSFFSKKGILGRGLSIRGSYLRMVVTKMDGSQVRIIKMQGWKIPSMEPEEVRKVVSSLGIPQQAHFGVNLVDDSLRMRVVDIPVMPKREVPQALRWQLMEDMEYVDPDIEIRYFSIEDQQMEDEKRRHKYMVFGMSRRGIEKVQTWYRQVGLNIVVGEPIALSLAAWQEVLDPGGNKVRAIFFLGGRRGDFVGLQGSRLLYWRSFPLGEEEETEKPHEGIQSLESGHIVAFQQHVDNFLLEYNLAGVDELSLAGDWDQTGREMVSGSLGIPCSMMGHNLRSVILDDEVSADRVGEFATELGLSIYPQGAI